MAYKRVTKEDRTHIARWIQDGNGVREISRLLGRAPSSISREIARNIGERGYRPKQAQEKANERALRPGSRRFTEEIRIEVELRLQEGWTPAIISGRARFEGRPSVCAETIYKYIYADAKAGGEIWKTLPRSHRKRRRRCPRQEGRGRGKIPNRRMIDTRPPEVETRTSIGHWEGDLINGAHGTGNLTTLVERCTRYTLIGRTDTKEAMEVTATICRSFGQLPSSALLSLTLDNGKEFSQHENISQAMGMDVFFARPYHSWERGTNENTNGLIRRLYPKKSSFADIGEEELNRIDIFLNDRPRKCLGWMTPKEKMAIFLGYAL